MEKFALFYVLALVAEVLGTVSGFGSSILFVPIASFFFEFKTVLGITALFHVFSNLSKIYLFRQGIDQNIALRLGIPAVVAVIAGAMLTGWVPQQELELAMSIVLVVLSAYLLIYSQKTVQPNRGNLLVGGLASGFVAGLVGSGGAIRGITLAAFQLEKQVFLATSALIDLGVDASRTVVYWANGYILRQHLSHIPFLLAISWVGSWMGKKILDHIPQKQFRWMVLGVVLVMAAVQLIKLWR